MNYYELRHKQCIYWGKKQNKNSLVMNSYKIVFATDSLVTGFVDKFVKVMSAI